MRKTKTYFWKFLGMSISKYCREVSSGCFWVRFSEIDGGTCQEAQCVIKWKFFKNRISRKLGKMKTDITFTFCPLGFDIYRYFCFCIDAFDIQKYRYISIFINDIPITKKKTILHFFMKIGKCKKNCTTSYKNGYTAECSQCCHITKQFSFDFFFAWHLIHFPIVFHLKHSVVDRSSRMLLF